MVRNYTRGMVWFCFTNDQKDFVMGWWWTLTILNYIIYIIIYMIIYPLFMIVQLKCFFLIAVIVSQTFNWSFNLTRLFILFVAMDKCSPYPQLPYFKTWQLFYRSVLSLTLDLHKISLTSFVLHFLKHNWELGLGYFLFKFIRLKHFMLIRIKCGAMVLTISRDSLRIWYCVWMKNIFIMGK